MARRVGRWGLLVAWMWLGGCFSGGTVVGENTSDGGLSDDAASAFDTESGQDASGCGQGLEECGGACIDTQSSVDHCGDCGIVCQVSAANTQPVCSGGVCGQNCAPGWSDGDEDPENGCELACAPTEGGEEICDGVDNDCNGTVDDGFSTGACTVGVGACEKSGQYVCADAQTSACSVSAGEPADELCGDAIDNDCDGEVDEDEAHDAPVWFGDSDDDGFGDTAVTTKACENPGGYVDNPSDCDDTDASIHTEVDAYADQDADGYTNGTAQALCTDGTRPSGYVSTQNGEDCDDTSAGVNPGADEVCGDQTDNNCDGSTDDASASDAVTWYIDCDGDGYASDTSGNRVACTKPAAPSGCSVSGATWTETRPGGSDTDCNDDEANAYPGQSAWFSVSMVGGNYNERWDYDCDGYVDRRYTNTDATCSNNCSITIDSAGWVASYDPSCGQSQTYQRCFYSFQWGTCDDGTESRAQTCH